MTIVDAKSDEGATAADETPVQCGVRDGVGVVTLNRPGKRNAMSAEMYGLFNVAMNSHQANADVKAILIAGHGKAFCAGGDLDMIDAAQKGVINADSLDLEFLQPALITKPIVCGVVGPCVGEGVAMVLACDMVICGESARFALPEVGLGIPPVDIPLLAARRLNANYIIELLLTGDWKDAGWADKVGLVNSVVPDGMVWELAFELARRIALAPPSAVALVKSLVYEARVSGDLDALRQYGASVRREIRQAL
ncbi:enoyl-CoA hydratase/isomerase family protein [Kineobactrum salinum]|uniref:Enoyl-CoA hydratase/isomerase family protein n=1 Tax=Kineobactrum salinum TaxID=2708301 RepID=A0A6C0TZ88_9GAMM|nr:enoyl-CoA hydratase/isomerase family protein [Kineobactrum salinum]QIB65101.1 enoyl-CoA hydratase/isomerase family protein [Kineobactrum salinum]